MAIDIHNSWPEWKGYNAENPFEQIPWLEYWSRDWRSFIADETAVLNGEVIPNVYNFSPYQYKYSGWGKSSPDGKPEEKAIGLLNPIVSALKEEARFKSAMGNHLRQNIYQPYAKDPTLKGDEIRFGPGDVNEMPVKDGKIQGIALFPVAQINTDLFPILASYLNDIQNASGSALLSGNSPSGDASGYLQGILVGQGRIKYRAPLRGIETIVSEAIRKALYMVKYVIKQPVPFGGGKFIRPDDIMEPIIVNVSLEPVDPAEDDRKMKLGLELHSKDIISTKKMREEYAHVSDQEESAQILVEAIKAMPQYQALLLGEALEKYEMKSLLAKLKELEAKGGIASQAAPYMENMPNQEQANMPTLPIKKQQRLGAPGSVNQLGSLPEEGVVNAGVPGAAGTLPVAGGIQP